MVVLPKRAPSASIATAMFVDLCASTLMITWSMKALSLEWPGHRSKRTGPWWYADRQAAMKSRLARRRGNL